MIKFLVAIKIKPTEKVLTIMMIALLALTILGGGLAVYLFNAKVRDKSKEADSLRKDVKEAQDKVEQIPDIKSKITDIKPMIEKLRNSIPVFSFFSEYDELALHLERIAKEAGVKVSETKFKVSEPGKGTVKTLPSNITEVECDVKVSGGFFSVLRYMNLLENSERFILIESFRPVKGGKGEGNISFTLKTFTYKGAPPPQPRATPTAGKTTPLPD